MQKDNKDNWTLVPKTEAEVAALRERCRGIVRRRAALAAGVSAVPIPGVDVVSDVALFTRLVEEINRSFGLTEAEIGRWQPEIRVMAYRAAAGVGGMLVGRLVTKELVLKILAKSGAKLAAKTTAKVVPLAGSIASAAIGFAVFRQMGYQHVEACAEVARQLLVAKTG
ncbi:hypothetical protein E4L96_01525 [Massilia arenosa]|uniref:DUF697 domain-containing protein n=1 Tax=Zemynaea arenosa TaxID=2561931 RepID=A0A4Y9SW23_9BURK|nr:hypothetical protein [Massilia arenosa]TFW29414.1 hypothetical protein E4L96_01525 [Massilia arenosa]